MDGSVWIGIGLATLASLNLNVGKGIQKWKVKVWGKGRAILEARNLRDLAIWCCGLLLTASATPIYSFALNATDKSSLVSSVSGVGMIGLVLFAWLVLRERIGGRELLGAALVIAGTALMGAFDRPLVRGQAHSLGGFLGIVGCLLAVFGALAVFAWRTNRLFGFAFGAIPGILIGSAIVLGDMALASSGGDMLGQFRNPYPYAAIGAGTTAMIVTQFAFWRAEAIVVVPTVNSFIILAPLAIEYFTFGTVLEPVQYAAAIPLVGGVVLLTATRKQARREVQRRPAASQPCGAPTA